VRHIKILDIFYGNKCNLTCNQCDTRSDVVRKGEYDPTIEDIKEGIILANKHFDVEIWSVLGGEPLLYKDTVVEILEFLRSIEPNKIIFFPTNGLLLDKNIDFMVHLIEKYQVWVQICNHTTFNKTITDKILKSAETIANRVGIPKLDPVYNWWYDIMKLESGTPNWIDFVKEKPIDVTDTQPNEIGWMENNYGIYYMEAHYFQSIHHYVNNVPKPFSDNDPKSSYWNSCPSSFCALLYNKKIYKCAALGTLKNFLDIQGCSDDLEWAPYLNYKPVDLENSSQDHMQHFADTHYCHIDECAMCPANPTSVQQDKINVIPTFKK